MESEIMVASTTDPQEAVDEAAGVKPAAKPAEAAPAEVNPPAEETKPPAEEAKPPKEPETEGLKPPAEPEKPPKPKSEIQRRIDKMTARSKLLEENLAAEREKSLALERRLADLSRTSPPAEAAPATKERPAVDQFKNYEEYLEALTDWKTDQRLAQAKQEEETRRLEAERRAVFDDYNAKLVTARETYEDFDEVVGSDEVQIPQAVQLAIIEMGNGPDVAYYLGKHPEVAAELTEMSPIAAIMHVGALSTALALPDEDEPPPPPKPAVAGKPEPIAPVRGSTTTGTKALDEVDYREYRRRRDAGEG